MDPLPHQLEAVYEHLLKLPRVRFCAPPTRAPVTTIMAGLLIRELKLRGLIERTLVACPTNLAFQWQRELNEKVRPGRLPLAGARVAVTSRLLPRSRRRRPRTRDPRTPVRGGVDEQRDRGLRDSVWARPRDVRPRWARG